MSAHEHEIFTFLVGGQAGQGVRTAGTAAAALFTSMGRYAFQMDDYPSLIRGGHNFSVVSTARRPITSQYGLAQLGVALDQRSYELHRGHVTSNGMLVIDDQIDGDGIPLPIMQQAARFDRPQLISGVASIAVLCAALGLSSDALATVIREQYGRKVEDNLSYATTIYDAVDDAHHGRFPLTAGPPTGRALLTGNEAIALGAMAAGLNAYFAYPMTPSTSILHFLAAHGPDANIVVMQPENELAVANMAIGAAFTGARVMVGSSGGGTALMEEAFSLAGMTEAPVVFVLSSRPGPSTGVPTYTEQGDLLFALHQGHGEFPHIVAAPASIEQAYSLTGELLSLAWQFQTPAILLTDKHLSESRLTVDLDLASPWPQEKAHQRGAYGRYRITADGVSPLLFPPADEVIKWNSYEHNEQGITTEEADLIELMHHKRQRKGDALEQHLKTIHTVATHGEGGPVIMTYGSTTLSVLEALQMANIPATVVQPLYLRPFPVWQLKAYRDEQPVVVEQSATGSFAQVLSMAAGISPGSSVRKFDGRPFDPQALADRLMEVL
jgi:2-oxoglutarate ferredoxin oxidoreductase subunit alpha